MQTNPFTAGAVQIFAISWILKKIIQKHCNQIRTKLPFYKDSLGAANSVIEHNIDRKPKKLWTNNAQGEKIIHYTANDERDEANFITQEAVKQKTLFNTAYGDMAVLYRTNAHLVH